MVLKKPGAKVLATQVRLSVPDRLPAMWLSAYRIGTTFCFGRCRSCWLLLVYGILGLAICPQPTATFAERVVLQDTQGDAVVRRTDTGADGPIEPANHQMPDLVSLSIGTWQPDNPQVNLFTGNWSTWSDFFRLELVFSGVVNPPGPAGCCGQPVYDPFLYGPNPISGYVEIDMDGDVDTGGELDWPDLRYLGNIARFGGLPQSSNLISRIPVDARAFDGNLLTPPYVERSGEDFHLELVGWEIDSNQIQRSDTSDWIFGPGETWTITGYLFHRAHGYSQFSSACCRSGVPTGYYDPLVSVRFAHQPASNRTIISLVYPLNHAGAAAAQGNPVEPMDVFFTNQNSVSEALWELKISAMAATWWDRLLAEFQLIAAWENKNPDVYLDPTLWRVTVVAGGSYTEQQDSLFVWSDVYPNVLRGDLNGDGAVGSSDLGLFNAYMQSNDGNPAIDADGAVNDSIEIADFGVGFSLYDLNYDGLVDNLDRAMIGGPLYPRSDYDRDGDVDQSDFGHLQACLGGVGQTPPFAGCRNADLDYDNDVDQEDLAVFMGCARGPAIPADPMCGRN